MKIGKLILGKYIDGDLSCRYEYLKITNGVRVGRYCGNELSGKELLVSGDHFVLTFHSDHLVENKAGFEVFWAEDILCKWENSYTLA